jgi:shikimate kinase
VGRKKLGEHIMKCIYLIGFMGSGKTTIGRELGASLKLNVIDTDEEISDVTQMTITEIFQSEGEDYFRLLESNCLKKLSKKNRIITTGGGMILKEENRRWMRENGCVIFLQTSPEEIISRLKDDQTRPLLKEKQLSEVEKMVSYRLPLYLDTANIVVDTTGRPVKAIVEEIIQRLANLTNGYTD